jgi:ubiquinone/menaquinone biosynthesis C-methylase UbiE
MSRRACHSTAGLASTGLGGGHLGGSGAGCHAGRDNDRRLGSRLGVVDHADHVGLIRAGVEGGGSRWLELGAGEGAFTLALADLLGDRAVILAIDRDAPALGRLEQAIGRRFPGVHLETRTADFRAELPAGPFDAVLAANSLHFVADPVPVLRAARSVLGPNGRLVVVEYDADQGNPWVPHPFSARRFPGLAEAAGFGEVREIGRVPSRFLGAIYAALAIAR